MSASSVSKRGRGGSDKSTRRPNTSSSSSGSSSDDDVHITQAEVQVEFEARTPEEGDFHGIQRLLRQLFLKAHVDLSALTEIILTQGPIVGSVLKQAEVPEEEFSVDDDDDDHVFGITSVVNITDGFKDAECIRQLHTLLLERASKTADDSTLKTVRQLLARDSGTPGDRRVGLLLNERFVNIPAKVAAPLYESLGKEMQAANRKGDKFEFDYYILVSKLFKARAPRKTNNLRGFTTKVFSNPEDELLFDRETVAWFEFSVADQADSGLSGDWDDDDDEGMTPFRRVAIIPAGEYADIVSRMRDAFA